MTDRASVSEIRLVGVGLVVGGIALGVLSTVVPEVVLAGALLLAAIVVRFEKPAGSDVLNLGLTLALFGGLLFLHAATGIGPFDAVSLAAFLVLAGLFEIVVAPRLVGYVDDGASES